MLATQVYETLVFSPESPDLGFQILTAPLAPPRIDSPEYLLLLDGADEVRAINGKDRDALWYSLRLLVGLDSLARYEDEIGGSTANEPREPTSGRGHFRWLDKSVVTDLLVPVEASPLTKRSIAELGAAASTVAVGVFEAEPILFVIGPLGLVVVRGAAAVVGALWEGARPEVVAFGRDGAAVFLNVIRRRLGIHSPGEEEVT